MDKFLETQMLQKWNHKDCDPMDCSPPGSSVHGSPDKNTGVDCHALLQENHPDPGIEPVSLTFPALADRFFTTPLPGKLQCYRGHILQPASNTILSVKD